MKRIPFYLLALTFLGSHLLLAQQNPAKILIAYHSETGNTEKLARAIQEGAKAVPNADATALKMSEVKDDAIVQCDGLIVGTPVHWWNASVQARQFIDRLGGILAKTKVWGEGRTAGVFCTGGNVSSGKDVARLSLISSLLSMRFIIVGGVDAEGFGTPGPQATTGAADPGIRDAELEEARKFGERFARYTVKIRR